MTMSKEENIIFNHVTIDTVKVRDLIEEYQNELSEVCKKIQDLKEVNK